ncbi:hypothetical protein JCM8547_008239 [Rhodosporidiobolus lusitaniae]
MLLPRRPFALSHRVVPRSPVASFTHRSSSSTSSPSSIPPVVGTAPSSPRHLLIHTPHPDSTWPSHLDSVSPLYRTLGQRWAKSDSKELRELGFNFTDAGKGAERKEWDKEIGRFERPEEGGEEEVYSATLYPDFIDFPTFSLSSLPDFEFLFTSLSPAPSLMPSPSSPAHAPSSTPTSKRTHIFVCTHSSRDCRCGDFGEPLYQALVREAKRRGLGGELKEGEKGVRIARVAHVGGHKWAGNALVYREGGACDWYGLLRDTDASALIDIAISPSSTNQPWFARWRGRLGLSPSEVKEAYASRDYTLFRDGTPKKGRKEEVRSEVGDPVEVVFKTWEGEERRVKGYEGESLMETAKRNDLPSILATCGGHCECATCHVFIPPLLPSPSPSSSSSLSSQQPTPIADLPPLPELTDEEDEQLEFAIGSNDDSRLACQIKVTKELGEWCERGGRVGLPRY